MSHNKSSKNKKDRVLKNDADSCSSAISMRAADETFDLGKFRTIAFKELNKKEHLNQENK